MRYKNKKGFTLIELVITLGIIAVLTAIIVPLFWGSDYKYAEMDEKARAMYYSAQGIMTDIKLTALVEKNDGDILLYNSLGSSPVSTSGKNYYLELELDDGNVTAFALYVTSLNTFKTRHNDTLLDSTFYVQRSAGTIEPNKKTYNLLLEKLENALANDEDTGNYLLEIDNAYRVTRVYYTKSSISKILEDTHVFTRDYVIERTSDKLLVSAYPLTEISQGKVFLS